MEINALIDLKNEIFELKKTYPLIIENINDLIAVVESHDYYKFEFINEQTFLKLLGYLNDNLIGHSILDYIHPDDKRNTVKYFKKGNKIEGKLIEIRIKDKKGEYKWFELKGKEFKNEKKQTRLLLILKDLSQLKNLKAEIEERDKQFKVLTTSIPEIRFWRLFNPKKYEEALQNSYEMLQMVMDNIPENIFWKDNNLVYLGCNRNYAMLIGAKNPQNVIGKTDFDLLKDKEKIEYLQTHETIIIESDNPEFHNVEPWYRNGREKIWLDVNRIPLHDSSGNSVGILVTSDDITEKREAERLIIEECKKLSELDQMREDLITRVSHELKTPLISVYSGTELLLNLYSDQFSDEIKEIIDLIYRGGKKLKDLVDNLLDVIRFESNNYILSKSKENLSEIIKECILDMKFLAKKRHISIEVDLPKEFYLKIDRIRIKQAITNILSNALINTPSNGFVYISLKENESYIDIIIKDTGVGLTEKEMKLIFKKFGKIERYGKQMDVDIEGSGLGLYISKEIIELHGGCIIVKSKGRNKGSTFAIRLFKKTI